VTDQIIFTSTVSVLMVEFARLRSWVGVCTLSPEQPPLEGSFDPCTLMVEVASLESTEPSFTTKLACLSPSVGLAQVLS
jgi:hypothetical protein